jgi:nanoRNase/pAp phosphatase (c-di-AMP/oligoRNAs hydrolase)
MVLKSLSKFFGKKLLIIAHSGADVDAMASAGAIYFSLRKKIQIKIGVPDHVNLNAKKLCESLGIKYEINPLLKNFDCVLCVDFSSSEMLGSMKKDFDFFTGEKFVIDHHDKKKPRLVPENNFVIRETAVSSTEIVYELLKSTNGATISKKAYACIAAGIISDSAGFMVADHNTFSIMADSLKGAGMSYYKVASLFYLPKDISESIAMLKAAKRARFFRSSNVLIAISQIGSFEADAASGLIKLGATVAFCGYAEKSKIRVSGRVNNNWLKENNFDLAKDVFQKLALKFGGAGGGHSGAAGFNGNGEEVESVLLECVRLVHSFVLNKFKGAKLSELVD